MVKKSEKKLVKVKCGGEEERWYSTNNSTKNPTSWGVMGRESDKEIGAKRTPSWKRAGERKNRGPLAVREENDSTSKVEEESWGKKNVALRRVKKWSSWRKKATRVLF